MPRWSILHACSALLLAACSAPEHPRPTLATAFDTVAWREELAGWASVREDWLPSPYGPLAQVALCRVDPAGLPAVVGGDPDATCRVPGAAVPDTVGLLVTRGDTLSLRDVARTFWVGERAMREARALAVRDRPDLDGALAWHGPIRVSARWADAMVTVWVTDTLAEARRHFAGITRWPPDPAWRFEATFVPSADEWRQVPTVRGFDLPREVAGRLHLEIGGTARDLVAYSKGRGARTMLVVIRDATSGAGSYPAGRFVDVPLPDSLGRTVVDFNLARNPDCAFTLSSPCPLPPPENRFTQPIEAGEQAYADSPTLPTPDSR
ncbi:MAG: DUF1684 domain-containing protein [Gemmatimonadales bacterium]